ncbi:protein LIM1-like [Cucumis melo var. makuwa]|uniref:Protein LIM1-like n=1 Tax=Cucumis melo var. makuwa TaxID=1194695 RepID=A0A5D3CJ93_CUCMM|nr:protein LIM1-like [Cucumis melo var. makuwa]TYK10456.1 protein LIM1-like [Cucumis melo var. makuwa]
MYTIHFNLRILSVFKDETGNLQASGVSGVHIGNCILSGARPSLSPFHPIPPSPLCCNAIETLGQSCICALLDAPPVSGVDYNLAMFLEVGRIVGCVKMMNKAAYDV